MIQIIENVKCTNEKVMTIILIDGKIVDITNQPHHWTGEIISFPDDVYVSPGWIDIHAHAFPKYQPYCAYPDDIGYTTGVTTVVDAGSSGADDFNEFYQI